MEFEGQYYKCPAIKGAFQMKCSLLLKIRSTYNDGAGNSCVYFYTGVTSSVTYLAKNSWKLRKFGVKRPSTNFIAVAYADGVVVGAPPAAGTRSVTFKPDGTYTIGANEVIDYCEYAFTLSDVEEHPYLLMDVMALGQDDVPLITVAGVDCRDKWAAITFIADADTFTIAHTLSLAAQAAFRFPDLTIMIAEHDLVSREYTGMYYELGLKAVVTMLQMASKEYAGLSAQVASYATQDNLPNEIGLNVTVHDKKVGVLA
jgi:hypothetical protein